MPVEPAPRKVRTPDEPALRRKDELINFWAERITQKIPFAADFPYRAATRHTSPRFEKNSIKMDGDSIYSYGHHFEMARIIRHPGGTARLVLCNGDRWSGPNGWGSGTFGDQMTTQRYVREAIEGTNIGMLIVPFSTLEAAGIDFSSVEPLHVREDRREIERHVYTERPGPLHKMADPSGATYPHSDTAWGFVNDDGEVWQGVGNAPEGYSWRSYTKVTEKPVMVDDPEHAYTKSYGRGERQHWYGDAELQSDGTWVWEEDHHRLGDSLFIARYVEHGVRKATKVEREQHIAHFEAYNLSRTAREAWGDAQRHYSNLRFVRGRYDQGRAELIDMECPTDIQIAEAEAHMDDLRRTADELESRIPNGGPAERRGDEYTVPFTRRRRSKFLSSYDFNEPHSPYFMCELPKTDATTIEDAIDALMPGEVRAAIELGLPVQRQGDIFAIPTAHTTDELKSLAITFQAERTVEPERYDHEARQYIAPVREKYSEPIRKLRGQGDASILDTNHSATWVIRTENGDFYGRGSIYHTPVGFGRNPEHRVQKLGDGQTWFRFVKNTVPVAATTNWRRTTMGGQTFQSGQSRAWMLGGAVD